MTKRKTNAETAESLLHGLIADCCDMVRNQLRPGLEAETDAEIRWGYARAVGELVKIAARTGEAVARLRDGGGETRHHIIVQRLEQQRGEG